MNEPTHGSKRPRLYLPKALIAAGYTERRAPILSETELRRIVADRIG